MDSAWNFTKHCIGFNFQFVKLKLAKLTYFSNFRISIIHFDRNDYFDRQIDDWISKKKNISEILSKIYLW